MIDRPALIDALQFCRWSRAVFQQMHDAGMTAVHATVAYHGSLRDLVDRVVEWNALLRRHADLIAPGRTAADLDAAQQGGRTAIVLGLQTCMPIEDDLGLVQVLHDLGIRIMQLTYNNQSLLGAGWQEAEDSGVTRMSREVIREMNRLGLLIDLSHSGERTTREAIDLSARPVAITHANPDWWRATGRNKSSAVLQALAARGGMLGLSLYPHHLAQGSDTTLEEFCRMAAEVAGLIGVDRLGIGSDLCQDQPDSVVRWMREGRWMPAGADDVTFPPQPPWFRSNADVPGIGAGLRAAGFKEAEAAMVMGGNWRRFLGEAFAPELSA